ncbi:type I polyketide synthase [Cytobacillus purgationiresistens]|uniref:Acyl transferase domain-containing protein n=1 Tax=Cytobacillus purgationiresistens TaxID=863449 RepID=A0ABU0ANW3_9BACI|nr:beta-ketoacyl synthase N-terminal-like domain-containing protein [Cytobacillus purgationiresistens]MDQ0272982.1 acyl transferase domain-containing protein [Cytobacillus purgationiresistens]
MNGNNDQNSDELQGIAIIGMTGRFPGANSTTQFWENLLDGKESITFFEEEGGRRSGSGIIEGADNFDAAFFEMSPREAEYTDPQHRLFLECVHEVLETSGYGKPEPNMRIGVYAGSGQSGYLLNVLSQKEMVDSIGEYQLSIGNLQDFLTTRVSYKFNLNGPSMAIQTACSSSLVAVHTAVQALLTYECDMALAGGVSVKADQAKGLKYQEGGILSEDGRCRAFDEDASGTVIGNGAGVVLLKRLEDAAKQGDQILAVIRGTAVNNDGSQKIGYTAPSVTRQVDVIKEALAVADVHPETITFVEAHGTGTALGDPVEVAALTEAFGHTSRKSFCALGSVKTNIGHLDSAAGIASLIKAVLSLQNKKIPPTLHFRKPNSRINFENSPFYVNTQKLDWDSVGSPRRAGVSSFGMGGTNAHVILEEYDDKRDVQFSGDGYEEQLLSLSAKTPSALKTMVENLITYLEQNKQTRLSDIACTLTSGRDEFEYRLAAVGYDWRSAANSLKENAEKWNGNAAGLNSSRHTVFLFPGKDSLVVKPVRGLYESQPVFKKIVDECVDYLKSYLSLDIMDILYPSDEKRDEAFHKLQIYNEPILFTIQYALALQWKEWGVRQEAMIGEGTGEYVVACLSGVLNMKDALRMVVERARFLEDDIPWSETEEKSTKLEVFKDALAKVQLKNPKITYISSITGGWITNNQATDPHYWLRHLMENPRMSEGTQELLKTGYNSFLEMGNEGSLESLVKSNNGEDKEIRSFCVLPGEGESFAFEEALRIVGEIWSFGTVVDRMALYKDKEFKRVPLPTYPYEKNRYFIEMNSFLDRFAEMQKSTEVNGSSNNVYGKEFASAPREESEVEEKIRQIWEGLLGIEGIKRKQDFFDLGGDSLMGIQLVTRLRETFHQEISMDIFFDFPTIAEMAGEIGKEDIEEEHLTEVEQLLREIEAMSEGVKQK